MCFTAQGANNGYEIKVKIDGFKQKKLYLCYNQMNELYTIDSASVNYKGEFIFNNTKALQAGIYFVAWAANEPVFDVLVTNKEQSFSVYTTLKKPVENIKFEGSEENTIFYDYYKFWNTQVAVFKILKNEYLAARENSKSQTKALENIKNRANQLLKHQEAYLIKYKGSFASTIIKAVFTPNTTEQFDKLPEEEKERQLKSWTHQHFFDNFDLGDSRMLRTRIVLSPIDEYISKSTVQTPDSIIKALDIVLQKLRPAEESFRLYLTHFLNAYENSRMPEVYVHLAEKYYAAGLATWASRDQVDKIMGTSRSIKQSFVNSNDSPANPLHSEPVANTAESYKSNVVAIRSFAANDFQLKGFGIITGNDSTRLFIATSADLARNIQKIQIRYVNDLRWVTASIVYIWKDENLALLEVPRTFWTKWSIKCIDPNPKTLQKVRFIGLNEEEPSWVFPGSGEIYETADSKITFGISTLSLGSVGSALVNEKGIIGIIVKVDNKISTAIPIKKIQTLLSNNGQYPYFSLLASEVNQPKIAKRTYTLDEATKKKLQELRGVSFEKILIQDRDGNVSSLQQIIDTQRGVDKKPLILFTWANQWCGPCIGVLDVFYTKFPDYQKEYDLKLLALNLNDQNKNTQKELSQFLTSSSKKRPWLAHSYFDPNSSFTKFFNVSGAPSTLYFVGDRIYKSHGFYGEIGENELHAQTMEKILRYLSSI